MFFSLSAAEFVAPILSGTSFDALGDATEVYCILQITAVNCAERGLIIQFFPHPFRNHMHIIA